MNKRQQILKLKTFIKDLLLFRRSGQICCSGAVCLFLVIFTVLFFRNFFLYGAVPATVSPGKQLLWDYERKTPVRYGGLRSSRKVYVPVSYLPKKREVRGIWVASIENLDFKCSRSPADFINQYARLIRQIKNAGFNTIIFQVRPLNDAFYPSKYNPYSRFLCGKEGQGFSYPAFDPLKFMISEAHRNGIEFHAWFNPYRVHNGTGMSKNNYLKTLSAENFAARNPDCVLALPQSNGKNLLLLDPGHPKVKLFLCDTIREVVENYSVDAIHLDDYFYPYSGIGSADMATYRKYGAENFSSIEQWRRNNIDSLIWSLHRLIQANNHKQQKNVRFGVSPFGIWANSPSPLPHQKPDGKKSVKSHPYGSLTGGTQSYFDQYADSRRWIREGWIDYIVPQLYWSFNHETAPYAALADWWAKQVRGTTVDLYIGHGVYKLGTLEKAWQNASELGNQLKYNMLLPEIKGSFFFSARHILPGENAVQRQGSRQVIEQLWRKQIPASIKN